MFVEDRLHSMVKISVTTARPGPPLFLDLPPNIQVSALRALIAQETSLPLERLKLVLKGRTLHDMSDTQLAFVKFADGDTVVAVVAPKAPPKHVQNKDGSDEEDELRFKVPQTASNFQRQLIYILREKLKLPDIFLIVVFSLSLRAWLVIIAWFVIAPIAYRWDLGPLYILATAFIVIFLNLGKRQEGEISAYSIFNEGFRELPGTLNADRLDRDIRAGHF